MPDGYRLSVDGQVLSALSSHLPLGILAFRAADDSAEVLPLAPGERLLLLSDGVLDTADDQERLFGVQRLLAVLADNRDPVRLSGSSDAGPGALWRAPARRHQFV